MSAKHTENTNDTNQTHAEGEIIETEGFVTAFILCAWLGGIAVILSILEWIRLSRGAKSDRS